MHIGTETGGLIEKVVLIASGLNNRTLQYIEINWNAFQSGPE